MGKNSKLVRMPFEAYSLFDGKRKKIQSDIQELTGRNIKISMPKFYKFISKHPVEIETQSLINFSKRWRTR